MLTIDAQLSLVLGGALAVATNLSKKKHLRDNILIKGLLFQCAIVSPLILFVLLRFSDWECQYLFNTGDFFLGSKVSSLRILTIALIVSLLNASFFLGFTLIDKPIRENRHFTAYIILGIAVLWDETIHLGTYADFNAGLAPLLFTNTEFVVTV